MSDSLPPTKKQPQSGWKQDFISGLPLVWADASIRLVALVLGVVVSLSMVAAASAAAIQTVGHMTNTSWLKSGSHGSWTDGDHRDRWRDPKNANPHDKGGPLPLTPGSPNSGNAAGGLLSGLLRSVQHGDIVITGPDTKPVTKRFVKGTVTAVVSRANASVVAIKSSDGYSAAFTVTAETKVRIDGEAAPGSKVAVGDSALAVGTVIAKAVSADYVAVD